MDADKVIEVLEWWIEHASAARESDLRTGDPHGWAKINSPAVVALREREDQTRRVIARVNGSTNLPDILTPFQADYIAVLPGIELAKYALGRIKTDAETRAMLGSSAPTMAADGLHPTVWNAASGRWDSGHLSDAVQRAATFLNAEVQDRSRRSDLADSALMREAFKLGDPEPGKARLRWPGADDDLTVRAMRVGILNYAQGIFSAIRNPVTHSTEDMSRQVALEQLAALSVLARWIDACEVVEA